MTLGFSADVGAAEWITGSGVPAEQLITFGPSGFEAYARLRFIPDPTAPGQEESDAGIAEDHPSEIEQIRRALRVLAAYTATPQDCYFCLWEGYSDAPLPPGVRLVEVPHRRYGLLRGAIGDWEVVAPPAFVWPADRRWCLARDVDPHWAGIGAGRAAIDALIADPVLDVVPAVPAARQPWYR